jgi:hypothetical protein
MFLLKEHNVCTITSPSSTCLWKCVQFLWNCQFQRNWTPEYLLNLLQYFLKGFSLKQVLAINTHCIKLYPPYLRTKCALQVASIHIWNHKRQCSTYKQTLTPVFLKVSAIADHFIRHTVGAHTDHIRKIPHTQKRMQTNRKTLYQWSLS